jgi:hypothetical protein
MARSGEQIYEWDKQPRMPLPAPPRKSCDCQGLEKFPPRPNPPYPPIESATFTEAQRMLGFDRGVIVHSAIYGNDHRLGRASKSRRSGSLPRHWHWPHPQWPKRMMNDAEEVELRYRYVDGDMELLCKILVDNPARLHGFKI